MKHLQTLLTLHLVSWPRLAKRIFMMGLDAVVLPVLVFLAHEIRLQGAFRLERDLEMLFIAPAVTLALLHAVGFYRIMVRQVGTDQVLLGVFAMALSVAALAALAFMIPSLAMPRSVLVIFGLLGATWVSSSRFLMRGWLTRATNRREGRVPLAIYGAGNAGIQAAAALQNAQDFWPVVFVDDNPNLQGTTIAGMEVVGRARLVEMVERSAIEMVLLAMPSLPRSSRNSVVRFLEKLNVRVKSVPTLQDILHGYAGIEDFRDVAVEDLLGRDPVPPDRDLLHASVRDKVVMVTGGGGSIGSELCRQVIELGPRKLIVCELNEFSLYEKERELAPRCRRRGVELVCVLGSVINRPLMSSMLRRHRVQTVYHAAAYKHVPIVEHNVLSGVENNVLGTLVVAEESERARVERFILVSTDKAVRPTNVMGASKRLAEMILQAMAMRGSRTVFSMVRFGNVLGSSGSVVPAFRSQILNGGPVTVTHPDVTRYFMTIPEAAQLVIQAGSLARGGEVFVLDMGDPVRIFDLARTMIRLMGYSVRDDDHPDGDIEIRFTGLRPGEKLYEELLIGEQSLPTTHPAIRLAHEEAMHWNDIASVLIMAGDMLQAQDADGMCGLLQRYVTGYRPIEHGPPPQGTPGTGPHPPLH